MVFLGEDPQHLVGLAQSRVGALDDRGEIVAPRGEAGAEVVDDQAEALGVGLAHDVVDQVEVDALPFCSSGRKRWPAPSWPSGITGSGGGGLLPGARGWVGLHSTNFSPSSDCGRIRQVASWRKSWKAGSSMFRTTAALPGSGLPSAWTCSSAR